MKVAQRIAASMRGAREACGLALEAVSSRTRIPLTTLVLFESGEVAPSSEELLKIASVLQTTPNALLAGMRWDQDQMRFEVEPPRAAV